jgi:hypothetical protein
LGYETDSYVLLPPATVCAAGLTVSNLNFAGSDFVRGKLHINLTAQTGTWTTTGLVAVLLQSSPDGGSTFYPDVAATVAAAGYASNTTIAGYQALFTAGTTPVVGKYSTTFTGFPGNLFRVAVYVVSGTNVTCGISGDFQKFVADQT